MKTFCFAAQSLVRSAAVMAGVKPLTSPPITLATFDSRVLEGHDLLFFKLHGMPGQSFWYGDGFISACSAEQIRAAKLDGALVFAANCFGGEKSPMVQALLDAGASAVVTGEGLNYAGVRSIDGADVIGFIWRGLVSLGFTVEDALRFGKLAAKVKRPRLASDIDSFKLVGQPKARIGVTHGSTT